MKKIIAMLGAVVVATAQAEALNIIKYYDTTNDDSSKWTTHSKYFKSKKEFNEHMDDLFNDENAHFYQIVYKDETVFDEDYGIFKESTPKYIKNFLFDWYGVESIEEWKQEELDEVPEEEQGNGEEILKLREEIYTKGA